MRQFRSGWIACLLAAAATILSPGLAVATEAAGGDDWLARVAASAAMPVDQFALANGLRVIVHTDRKAPVVAVAVYYGVGSRDEPPGKTGFAHLFEHLMFNGSENAPGNIFNPLRAAGATDMNGTTSYDHTRYFETVPVQALEQTLYLESDRMGHLLGAVTQQTLDRERAIIKNEKRQREGQPLGQLSDAMRAALLPQGHPYRHSIIGSTEDLNRASLQDVRDWFARHYGPGNAVLVMAGDIDPVKARTLAERYFGDLPGRRVAAPVAVDVPTLAAPKRLVLRDRIGAPRLYRVWAVPGQDDPDLAALDVGMSVLGGPVSSRLDRILVREEQLAVRASAGIESYAGISFLQIQAEVKEGVDPARVERRIDAILHDYLAKGPNADEVARTKGRDTLWTVAGLEWIGGYVGKAAMLADGTVSTGDPLAYQQRLATSAAVTPASIITAMNRWMRRPALYLTVMPGERPADEEASSTAPAPPAVAANGPVVMRPRAPMPDVGPAPQPHFPVVETAILSNGIRVHLVPRPDVPTIRLSMMFDAGHAADPRSMPGTQELMLSLLREGTRSRSATDIAQSQERMGAIITASAGRDRSSLSIQGLAASLRPSIALMADMVRNPTFDPEGLARVRSSQLARIAQEPNYPQAIAGRILPKLLYGPSHPYGGTEYALGNPQSMARLTRADLIAFHDRWYRPDMAEIFAIGAVTMPDLISALEAGFGDWKAPDQARPFKDFEVSPPAAAERLLLIDRPGATQAQIFAGQRLDATGKDDLTDLDSAVEILGGDSLSRLNVALREKRGWSYGVDASLERGVGGVALRLHAPVEAAHAGEAIALIKATIGAFLTDEGVNEEELARSTTAHIRELPGRFEASASIIGEMQRRALYDRPADDLDRLVARYKAQTATALDAAIRRHVSADRFAWIVIGDKAALLPQLQELGMVVTLSDDAGSPLPAK